MVLQLCGPRTDVFVAETTDTMGCTAVDVSSVTTTRVNRVAQRTRNTTAGATPMPGSLNWENPCVHYKVRPARVVYSAVLPVLRASVGSSPEPPPMLADTSAGTGIKNTWMSC